MSFFNFSDKIWKIIEKEKKLQNQYPLRPEYRCFFYLIQHFNF